MLAEQPKCGVFLIRESESTPGGFSLSVKVGDSVQHFKVIHDDAGKYFIWYIKFNSLNQLVDYYRTTSVSQTQPNIYLMDMVALNQEVHVKAMYDFEPQETDELLMKKGYIILVIDKGHSDWWKGRIDNHAGGIIPSSLC